MNMNVWVCAVAKMEELYIREWIEWNKKIGIDHIILGDNNDSNYEIQLKPIIQDYIDEGYVEYINKNDVLNVQQPFYKEIYKTRKNEFDWIGFIDIDEFIDLYNYNDIHNFLCNVKTDSVILEWQLCYGDENNCLYYTNKQVKDRFTLCKADNTIKYFVRSLNNFKPISFHNPTCGKSNKNISISDSEFNTIYIEDICRTRVKSKFNYNKPHIKHYLTKSLEEFIKYKILRGRCDRKINNYELRYNTRMFMNLHRKLNKKIITNIEKIFNKYAKEINEFNNLQLKKYNMI